EDDADVDGAQDQQPALGVDAHEVLEEYDDGGAGRRAEQRALATERDHEQRLDGRDELHVYRADEAVVVRPEHAGEAGEGAGDDEGQVLVEPHVVAEDAHARFALADALEAHAERRSHDHAEQRDGHQRADEREVEEGQRLPRDTGINPRQPEVRPRDARDAVVTLGQRNPPEREPPDDHAERQRDHQEVRPGRADGDETEERGGDGRDDDPGDQTQHESTLTLGGEDGDGGGGDAEVGGVPERGHPGEARLHVEAHREDRDDHGLGEQRERIRRQPRRHHRGQRGDDRHADEHAGAAAHHARPKRPVGRSARISAIGANSVKYESSGNSALPKWSTSPARSLPTLAPGKLPSPPTITTTNAQGRTSKSPPRYTPSNATPSTPPEGASREP